MHRLRAGIVSRCVDKFQRNADAASNLVEFKKASSWQGGFSSKRCLGGDAWRRANTRPLRRPAPRCPAVFKSDLADAISAVADGRAR
jgi:hypothetical protein